MAEQTPENSSPNITLYPLAWLVVFFASGILLENYSDFSRLFLVALIVFLIVGAVVFINRKFVGILVGVSFVIGGAFCFQTEKSSVAPNRLKKLYDDKIFVSGDPLEVTGILQGKPELAVGGFFLELSAENVFYKGEEKIVSGNVRLFAPVQEAQTADEYEALNLRYGARIRVACELRREDRYRNPGIVSVVKILDQKNLDATGIIKSPLLVERLGDTQVFAPLAWAFEQRQNLIFEFKKYFSAPTAGVLIASLLGNRYHLDKPTSEKFREGGTFHALVISGLQITFIGTLAVFLLRIFTRSRWRQFILASGFLWSYSLAVGADAPVVRAAMMFTILLFGRAIFRQGTLLNSLGAAALILLIKQPSDIFDQSFQLTFMCVAAIVAMAFPLLEKLRAIGEWRPTAETPIPPNCSKSLRKFCETLYWSEAEWRREQARAVWSCNIFKTPRAAQLERLKLQKILRLIFETFVVSAIVQAWLAPFLIVYFHRVSLIGIFLNVWVGIVMAIESLAAIAGVFAAQFSTTLAAPFILLTEISNWILLHAADPFIEIGWASLRIPHYAGALKIIYAIYFLPVIFLTVALRRWKPFALEFIVRNSKFKIRLAAAIFATLFLLIIFHPFSQPTPDGRLHVDFLDVGQGDSALVTMPTGETLLVDGGGKINLKSLYVGREGEEPELFAPDVQNIGEAVVSNYLWEKGYSKIDYILATHADADHIQGLADAAQNFQVTTAIFGRTPANDEDFADLDKVLRKRKIPSLTVSRGDVLTFGAVTIEVLYPNRDDAPDAVSDNNHSVVLRVNFGARKFLLTGDIEQETERELLNAPKFLQTDVIKVAHHGSRTSSTEYFVNASQAKFAVISVGTDSPFGHPRPEVVERWKNSDAKVMTTGENGTISVSTDGKDLRLETFGGRQIFR